MIISTGWKASALLIANGSVGERQRVSNPADGAALGVPGGAPALRHTFASHLMANDGNILSLHQILGYSTLHRVWQRKLKKKPYKSTWKAITPGGVAGLQTL